MKKIRQFIKYIRFVLHLDPSPRANIKYSLQPSLSVQHFKMHKDSKLVEIGRDQQGLYLVMDSDLYNPMAIYQVTIDQTQPAIETVILEICLN